MKSDKLKKLLKKIKKLKKLKKAKKVKKSKVQNLNLNADIETLKQKLKQQEILLSQLKYPQPAPVSSVSYERMGIGQQNALNQANLESIQKNIEDKIEDTFEDQSKKIDSELKTAVKAIKQRDVRPQKENESDKDYNEFVKKSIKNKNDYRRRALKKSLETTNQSLGVKSKVNTQGTLKKPVYSDTDNQGEFPVTDFNSSVKIPNPNETIDTDVETVNTDIQSSLNQIDSKEDLTVIPNPPNQQFIDTTSDQNIVLKKDTTQVKKKISKNPNPDLNVKGIAISVGKKKANINNTTAKLEKDAAEVKNITANLNLDNQQKSSVLDSFTEN